MSRYDHATTYTYNALSLGTEKDSSGNLIAYTRDTKGNLISERTSSGNWPTSVIVTKKYDIP